MNETIADIRKDAEARFRELLEKHVDSLCHIQAMQQFNQAFDRIEAAARREVEKLNSVIQATVSRSDAEIDRLRREVAELRKQSGNAAKLREALKLALSLLDLKEGVPYKTVSQKDIDFMKAALAGEEACSRRGAETQSGNAAKLREAVELCDKIINDGTLVCNCDIVDEARAKIRAALAAPARQCDVGTAEEQEERCWRHYIRSEEPMICPTVISGALKFAQMPYESEAKG